MQTCLSRFGVQNFAESQIEIRQGERVARLWFGEGEGLVLVALCLLRSVCSVARIVNFVIFWL